MTRLMLDGGRAGGGGSGSKPRRENRRETWCPGAGGCRCLGWAGLGWVGAGSGGVLRCRWPPPALL